MKRKNWLFGTAVTAILLVFALSALSLAGCDDGSTSKGNPPETLIGGTTTLADNTTVSFSVSEVSGGRSARAAVGDNLTPIKGQVQYGNTTIDIEGFYDPVSENFSFSGASGNLAFEFFGVLTEGQAAGKLKTKVGNNWLETFVVFDIDPSVFVNGAPAAPAPSLPERMRGKWNYSEINDWGHYEGNRPILEQFGGPPMVEGNLIITQNGFSFWFDVAERIDYVEGEVANAIENGSIDGEGWWTEDYYRQMLMVEQVYNRQAGYSIYEIVPGGPEPDDRTAYYYCDVLASKITLDMAAGGSLPGVFEPRQEFSKFRIIYPGNRHYYSGELWIVFYTFDDEFGNTRTRSEDIDLVRSAVFTGFTPGNDYAERDNWDGYNYPDEYEAKYGHQFEDNYTLFVLRNVAFRPGFNPY